MAYRLMIGEKSPTVRSWLELTFPPDEFILQFFADGQELRQAIEASPPDVVLCRISLPEQDGYQIAEWFKEEDLNLKTGLILFKGPFEEIEVDKAASLPVDKLIELPIASQELLTLVQDIIDSRRLPENLPEEPEEVREDIPPAVQLGDEMRQLLREEILEMERELEKRLGSKLKLELARWLEARLARRKDR
ncbi:response regulator [Candidatus Aminicenantes bacterium AC-334-K16]|jgi:CheY-like chemotaxis protein|nr:response regulator [Candidatus Aminicenantes bacterium AC-334-K16]